MKGVVQPAFAPSGAQAAAPAAHLRRQSANRRAIIARKHDSTRRAIAFSLGDLSTEGRAYGILLDTGGSPHTGKVKTRAKGRMTILEKRVPVSRVAHHPFLIRVLGFVAVATLLATIGTQPASALPTMEEAQSAYQLHLHGRPVEVLRKHAEQGNAVAQFTLGQMYVEDTRHLSAVLGVPEMANDDLEAARWLHLAAEQGHPDAQLRLGLMYALGEGVPTDDAEAMRWFRLAAEQGNESAQGYLKNMSETGSLSGGKKFFLVPTIDRGTIQEVWEALTRDGFASVRTAFQMYAEQGNALAQFHLGFMYAHGQGGPEDDAEAARWYRLAAEQGNADAQSNLALMYDRGEGVPEDDTEAVRWYRLSAEQGNAVAQFNLGVIYDNGEGVPEDDAEAVRWYRLAAEQGQASAQSNLGLLYARGEGVPEDDTEAVRWYRLSAEQGNAVAQFNLGVIYDNGEGVPEDDAEAVRWYRLAAEQGHAGAQFNLALMYANGEGVPEDDVEAVRWYRLAAEQGYARAQFNLALMYDNGEGVPEDDAEAVRWYRLAAEQGDLNSQHMLGLMYEMGEGVTQDYREAVRWYRRAAEYGHAGAQSGLGEMYYFGKGVPQSYEKAMRWSRLAAAQRDAAGMVMLGRMYEFGKGTPRDLVQAHMWFNLASPNQFFHDVAAKSRDRVAARLTSAEVARAQRLARDWRPSSDPSADTTDTGLARADRVRALQRALAKLHYDPGPADGVLGPRTRAAIRAFQAASGLPSDGAMSPELYVEILSAISKAGQM